MLLLDRKYLPVFTTDTELESISKKKVHDMIMNRPANVCYLETEKGLYGMVSFGDILKSEGDEVRVNRNFTSFERHEHMKARKMFREHLTICEIPVVRDGKLIGEFHQFDDELILDRARGYEYNAYSKMYFASLGKTGLVAPPEFRDYKKKYFDEMKKTLEKYGAGYEVIGFSDMVDRPQDFDTIIVVDEQEKRGAELIMRLFRKNSHYFYRIVTCYGMQTKLESSEVMDYEETLKEFEDKGVDVVLITANHSDREYVLRTDAEMKARFPYLTNNLNAQMKPYEEQFFDDMYENREYVENIVTGYFEVEKDRENMRLRDIESPYINIKRGERRTVAQPEDYTRTIFFYGPCLVIGSYVGDEYTIESYLQKMINDAGYKVRVVNCGCWGGNVSCVSRMVSTLISEGDIIVALLEDLDLSHMGFDRLDLWEALEKHNVPSEWMLDMPYHVNHHVNEIYARELFEKIFDEDYEDKAEKTAFITQDLNVIDKFFIKKYFYGMDLDCYGTVACSVTNGNPFTNGHRYLIETAASQTDHVYLLSVQENSSIFSYGERYAMAYEAVKDLENVTIVPSGLFLGNMTIFPAYYAKIYMGDTREQAIAHVECYASVARMLKVTHRYIGEEPVDIISNEINLACREVLPKYGIETVILKRKEENGKMITGTMVRELAEADDPEIEKYVPETTADIIFLKSINKF